MNMGFTLRVTFGVRAMPDEKQQSFLAAVCGYFICQSHVPIATHGKISLHCPGLPVICLRYLLLVVALRVWSCRKSLRGTWVLTGVAGTLHAWGFAWSVPGFMDRSCFPFVGFLFVQPCNQKLIKDGSTICQVSLSPWFLVKNEDRAAQFSQFSTFICLCAWSSV